MPRTARRTSVAEPFEAVRATPFPFAAARFFPWIPLGCRTDLFHGEKRLGEEQAGSSVLRAGETELNIAVENFAFAAEKARRNPIHATASQSEELFESQQIERKICSRRYLVKWRRRFVPGIGLVAQKRQQIIREHENSLLGCGRGEAGLELAEALCINGPNQTQLDPPRLRLRVE